MKQKRCKSCKGMFEPVKPLQSVCSPLCACALVQTNKDKLRRKDTKTRLEAIKPRVQWLREAQSAFNRWIRLRDDAQPCISCGRHHGGQYHAGHYLSTGARPELRFDEFNVHKQCQPCNMYRHGNLILYRGNLIAKIGQSEVDRLEGPAPAQKYTIDDLKQIKRKYSELAKGRKL
jgi:hypothetical protein